MNGLYLYLLHGDFIACPRIVLLLLLGHFRSQFLVISAGEISVSCVVISYADIIKCVAVQAFVFYVDIANSNVNII